jgi:hypothetical protein
VIFGDERMKEKEEWAEYELNRLYMRQEAEHLVRIVQINFDRLKNTNYYKISRKKFIYICYSPIIGNWRSAPNWGVPPTSFKIKKMEFIEKNFTKKFKNLHNYSPKKINARSTT